MRKILLIVAGVVLLLVVLIAAFLGPIIRTAVVTAGPRIMGVPVELERVRVNPLSGTVHVQGLVIGNPEGFKTSSAMELGELRVRIDMGSLFSDPVVIREIFVSDPRITYEQGLRANNLSRLQAQLAEAAPEKPADAETEPARETAPAKKVVIERFELSGARVNASLTAMGGRSLTVPLPPVRLNDIGKESDGASPAEVVSRVLRSITSAVTDAVSSAAGVTGDALRGAGGAATDAARGATDAIRSGVGGLLRRGEESE